MDLSFLSGVFASPWSIFINLLDISIVAYIFYRLLRWIRGTRAEQLLKGLIVLLVFSAVVSYMQLAMLSWLLEKLWIIFAITLPIVFQPELRRILEQLGQGSFLSSPASSLETEVYRNVVREIADAVKVLSHNRVGALIIITREADIREYLESGVYLESVVSAGLLINIFVPNTPLHDGAAIIKDGRIEKAACFLPLSGNPGIDSQLGTRHRAGLGISEVSDALAVIVSEETGIISVARQGRLLRFNDAQGLKDLLEKELLLNDMPRDHFWRRWSAYAGRQESGKRDRA